MDLTREDPEIPLVSTAVTLVLRNLQTGRWGVGTPNRCEQFSHQVLLSPSGAGCVSGAQVESDFISCCVLPGVCRCLNEPDTSLCPRVPHVTTRIPLVTPGMPHQPSA